DVRIDVVHGVLGDGFVDRRPVVLPGPGHGGQESSDDIGDETGGSLTGIVGVIGGRHGPAAVVAEDDEQGSVEHFDAVLERAEGGRVDDLTGVANDEHIAEADVEDHLSGDAGIRAAEEGDEGLLIVRQRFASCCVLVVVLRNVVDDSPFSLQESILRLIGYRFRTCFRFRDGGVGPGSGPGQGGQMSARRAASSAAYMYEWVFAVWCSAKTCRTVPDFDRMTSEWVVT